MLNYKHDPIEMAKIIGEPRDPRRPYPKVVEQICFVDTALPNEFTYTYDVLDETDKVYLIGATGEITQENVAVDAPALLSFTDNATPELWVQLKDLMSAKEKTLARKNRTINRAMNAYEVYNIVALMDAACTGSGNEETLESGQIKFRYSNLINMLQGVVDFGDDYVLTVGTTIDSDIKLWDFDENKYHSLKEALADLDISITRVRMPLTLDDVSTTALTATKAYLVARDTEVGLPIVLVRKEIGEITSLPGVTTVAPVGPASPQRAVIVGAAPMTIPSTSKRYLGVSLTGYGQFGSVVRNPYAIYEFSRV